MIRVMSFNPIIFGLGCLAATWIAISFTQKIDYHTSPIAKHIAWAATSSLVGLSILPLCAIAGGQIIQQARVKINPDDTLEQFEERLHAAEHQLLPAVIRGMAENW